MSLCKCIKGLTPLVFMVCGCASILFGETCYLFVRVIDVDGRPVSGATVSVSALQTCAGWYVDSETDYGRWFAKTDSNGIAKVEFACINGRFTWSVRKVPDGYHPFKNYYTVDIPCRTVESDYLYLDPKTKQGRAMLRELRELEEKGDFDGLAQKLGPKSCSFLRNRFHRVATIYPKRNPDSMYGHSSIWGAHLPPNGSVESNGLEVAVSLPPAEFDLKYARFLPPVNECKPPKEGLVADFRVVRQLVETNDGRILRYCFRYRFVFGCHTIVPSGGKICTEADLRFYSFDRSLFATLWHTTPYNFFDLVRARKELVEYLFDTIKDGVDGCFRISGHVLRSPMNCQELEIVIDKRERINPND